MRAEHIVVVAVRLFAIWLVVSALRNAVEAVAASIAGFNPGVYLIGIVTLVPLASATLLWVLSDKVAKKILRLDASKYDEAASISGEELQVVAFSTLGIYYLVKAISNGIYWLSWLTLIGPDTDGFSALQPQQQASIISTFIELILACFLVFRAREITGIIRKLRRAGLQRSLR